MRSARPSQMTILTTRVGANHTLAPMIIPPDGGWGWVIVFTGFMACAIIDGISYCFFLYRDGMMKDLKTKAESISFLTALFTGFYFIGGILGCSAGNQFGFRSIMVFGAATSAIAFCCGWILDDIVYFLILVGFVAGLAAGFIFVAGVLPAGFYFDKRRCLAMGIIGSGSGMGAVVLPQVTKLFMDRFSWRWTYVFHGGLCALLIIMGFLIRPLKPVMVIIKPSSKTSLWNSRGTGGSSSPINMSLFRVPALDAESVGPISNFQPILGGPQTQPTIQQMAHELDVISIRVRDGTERSMIMRINEMSQSRMLQPSASVLVPFITIEEEDMFPLTRRPWYKCGCCQHRHSLPERPLLRTDLYYTGSLSRLNEYTEKDNDLQYHMHVTKVPTYFETMQDLTRVYTTWCCRNILHGIKLLLDYTLLKSPTFLCFALCGFANYVAFFLPFFYGKVRLEKTGQGEYGASLVSVIGFGNMIGRLATGFIISAIPRFGARTLASLTSFIAALLVVGCTFAGDLYIQFGTMMLYGVVVGFFAPLRSIIIVDFFGLNKLTSVTGMMILFQGLGSFLGAPLAESVMDFTKNDDSPYYVCGTFLLIASMSLWPMRILQSWEKKKKRKKETTNNILNILIKNRTSVVNYVHS